MQHMRKPPPPDAVASWGTNHVIDPVLALHTGQSPPRSVAAHHLLRTRSPPQTAGRSVLATTQSTPRNRSFFSPAQARVEGSAPPASDTTITPSPNAKEQNYGTVHQAQPERTIREDLSRWTVSQFASTGRFRKGAPLQATLSDTDALDAEKWDTEPSSALAQRRLKTISPYTPKAWSSELNRLRLQDKYPFLIRGLEDGLHLGVPKIRHTYTPSNHHSINSLHDIYTNILESEFAAGRYIGPFTHCQLEAEVGRFQSSPLSLVPKALKPGKYQAVHDFSYPHTPLANTTSINAHIDSDSFPCTWGTFSTVALLIS